MADALAGHDLSKAMAAHKARLKRLTDDTDSLDATSDRDPSSAPNTDAADMAATPALNDGADALTGPTTPSSPSTEPVASDDDDRHKGLALWALAGAAGIGGIAMLAGSGKSASGDQAPAGQPPVGDGSGAPTPDEPVSVIPGTPLPPDDGTVPPPAPSLPPAPPPHAGHLSLQLAADTGRSAVDQITANPQFQLQVVGADPDTSVRYQYSLDGGQTWQDNTALTSPWPDGHYLLRAVVSNGDSASITAPVALTLDSQAPAAAELLVSGTPVQGQVLLAMNGVEADASSAYEISLDQGQTWQHTQASLTALLDGDYLFRGVVTDAAGNQSVTAVQSVTVDTAAPAPMTLQLRKVGEQGWDALSPLSSTGAVDLKLTLPPGTTAMYQQSSDNGQTWATVSPSIRNLAEGRYSFRALVQDAAGNETVLDPVPFTVDKTPLPALSISALLQDGQGDARSGYLSRDGSFQITPDRTDANAQVLYQFRLEGATAWRPTSAQVDGLLDGRYEYRVGFRDPAGNMTYSNTLAVEVDTQRTGAGTITLGNFVDSGVNEADRITADNTFTLVHRPSGTATAIQWQRSLDNGDTWSTTTASQSNLRDGHYLYRAVVTDDQGQSFTTRSLNVTVDVLPPSAATLTVQDLDDTGSASDDFITQDGRFNLGLLNPDPAAKTTFEVSYTGSGGWFATSAAQDLASGSYWFRAASVDVSGVNSVSKAVKVVVDRDAPAATPLQLHDFDDTGAVGDRLTSDTDFTLSTPPLEAGATVRFLRSTDGGATWATTDAAQQGLADGDYWFRTEVTDLAGNTRLGEPRLVTVDSTAPQAGTLTVMASSTAGVDLQWTGEETPDTLTYQVSTDQGQTWLPVLVHSEGLLAGDYLFRAVVTDAAGNAATSAPVAWQVAPQDADVTSVGALVTAWVQAPEITQHAISSTEALWMTSLTGSPFAPPLDGALLNAAPVLPPVAGV